MQCRFTTAALCSPALSGRTSQPGRDPAHRKHVAVFLIVTTGTVALASGKQKPGMLLNVLQCTGQHLLPSPRCSSPLPTTDMPGPRLPSGAKVKNPFFFFKQDGKGSFINKRLQYMKHWVFQENKPALKAHLLVRKADLSVITKLFVSPFTPPFPPRRWQPHLWVNVNL